jgi:alanyl-tRNA synthetase
MGEGGTLPGETAFKLYDTFGFPYDLTEDAMRARGLTVDRAGFDSAMAEQKAAARAAWKGSGEKASDELWYDIVEALGRRSSLDIRATTGKGSSSS